MDKWKWAPRSAARAAREEREREQYAEESYERAVHLSVVQARERGEAVDCRGAARGELGRTPAEAVAYISAMADIEDAKAAAWRRKEFAKFEAGLHGDTSAPTPAEYEAGAEREQQGLAFEKRQVERKAKDAEEKKRVAQMLALARSVVKHG